MNPWKNIDFDYPNVPTMISAEERNYLYWLGSQFWRGRGHVVEIGPWLGGSTICLAAGMSKNSQNSSFNLHVYDNFIWREFMSQRCALPIEAGESFQTYFEHNVRNYFNVITIHRQTLPADSVTRDKLDASISIKANEEIPQLEWGIEEPVEILFIDGAKSWDGFRHLLTNFCKFMEPGNNLIVCQDYKYWGAYWIPLIMEYFSDKFKFVHNLPNNTVAFSLVSQISHDEIHRLGSVDNFDLDEGLGLLESASQRFLAQGDRLGALIIQSCKIRFCFHKKERLIALEVFRKLESKWPNHLDGQSIDKIREWLENETQMYHKPSRRWTYCNIIRKFLSYLSFFNAHTKLKRIFSRFHSHFA